MTIVLVEGIGEKRALPVLTPGDQMPPPALLAGIGEKRALPVLTQRAQEKSVRCIDMKGKSNIIRRHRGFEDTVRRQHALGAHSFVVLIDGDVTSAPYQSLEEERLDMPRRAQSLAQELQSSIQVCWAVLEMESWLIGGIAPKATYCRLKGVGQVPVNTETAPADPKAWLEQHLGTDYEPRIQECLARNIDLQTAQTHNHSMRIFLDCIGQDGHIQGA
jgi:hypothetical protein